MQMAKSGLQDIHVRCAEERDLPMIAEIMQHSRFNHIHVDWRVPRFWLRSGAFMVAEAALPAARPAAAQMLQGCLAVGADPPPAAWVRVAAIRVRHQAAEILASMLEACSTILADGGVEEIGWLPRGGWPQEWMEAMGFAYRDEVVTYTKESLVVPAGMEGNGRALIRPVRAEDLPRLVEIEEAAFEPLWRHSAESLAIGWQYSVSFHVAELNGRVVGFQYSSDSDVPQAGHLVRLTVDPRAQRGGVGSALLHAALQSYQERGFSEASLNTQLSNEPSRRLYEKFGFKPAGYHWPVWTRSLTGEGQNDHKRSIV